MQLLTDLSMLEIYWKHFALWEYILLSLIITDQWNIGRNFVGNFWGVIFLVSRTFYIVDISFFQEARSRLTLTRVKSMLGEQDMICQRWYGRNNSSTKRRWNARKGKRVYAALVCNSDECQRAVHMRHSGALVPKLGIYPLKRRIGI